MESLQPPGRVSRTKPPLAQAKGEERVIADAKDVGLSISRIKDVADASQQILGLLEVAPDHRDQPTQAYKAMLVERPFEQVQVSIGVPMVATALSLIDPEQSGTQRRCLGQQTLQLLVLFITGRGGDPATQSSASWLRWR